jgi:hypothetical protein
MFNATPPNTKLLFKKLLFLLFKILFFFLKLTCLPLNFNNNDDNNNLTKKQNKNLDELGFGTSFHFGAKGNGIG